MMSADAKARAGVDETIFSLVTAAFPRRQLATANAGRNRAASDEQPDGEILQS